MKNLLLLFCLLPWLRPAAAQTQAPPAPATSHILTVFAQEGERFYLILDGQRQNDKPLARVTVKELDRPYYKVKVIFDNEKLPSVDASVQLEGVDPGYNDVTYVVRRKGGKKTAPYVIRSYSFTPRSGGAPVGTNPAPAPGTSVPTGYIPANAPVTDPIDPTGLPPQTQAPVPPITHMGEPYGKPTQVVVNIPEHTETKVSTTTTQETRQTPISPAPRPAAPCSTAMTGASFDKLKASLKAQSFEDKKLGVARTAIKNTCLTTDQVKAVIGLFNFEENRLAFAKDAYAHTVDKDQYFSINDAFKFSSSVDDLNAFLSDK